MSLMLMSGWCAKWRRLYHSFDLLLILKFVDRDAKILEVSNPVEVDLTESGFDGTHLSGKLRAILEWGSQEKRPELVGMD